MAEAHMGWDLKGKWSMPFNVTDTQTTFKQSDFFK